ncbi:MAG: DUF5602 domain-containing protein [Arcicella sp.]|jgi:hypothetical protein|nr:DUF5602 domain-containing protein [Arcicella sp.]
MKKIFFTCLASAMLMVSCKKEEATTDPNPTYNGVAQTIGNGKAYTWVKFNGDKPTSIGLTLSKGALENIPHGNPISLSLALPNEAVGKTPFDHLYLDFSHSGHEPIGIYDKAHFDVHFMMQPNAERSVIPPYSPTTAAKFDNLPPAGIMPVPYFRLPEGVPLMGVHWADPTSPELNGSKFTHTLIMGSYDGKMTFIEPMISLELLLTKPNITKNIPTPAKFAKAGYYPMKYSIKQVGDDITISLDELMIMQ